MSTTLRIHDFPDPTQHSPRRSETTTPLQGLYALNGPLLTAQADALVARLNEEESEDAARIRRAYWLLFSRPPTEPEHQLALQFLGDTTGGNRDSAWKQYAHVLLASDELFYVD